MNPPENPENLFLSTLHELEKHCQDSCFSLQRDIDDFNMNLVAELQSSSFFVTQEIQQVIQEIISLKKRIEAFQAILVHVKFINNTPHSLNSFPTEFPKVFESILWLLRKLESHHYFEQVRKSIEVTYGNDTLSVIEKFEHIEIKELESFFEIDFDQDQIKDYLNQIQGLYFPGQEIQFDDDPGTDFPEERDPEFNSQQPEVNLLTDQNPPEDFTAIPDPYKAVEDTLLKEQEKFPGISAMEEEKSFTLNRSTSFDFNLKQNDGLQVSIMKGVKTDNIEFFDQIQPVLEEKGELFTDEAFPPVPTSISHQLDKHAFAKEVIWKRIPEVYAKKKVTVCSDQMSPGDINQGKLGNCFFLSALSVLAGHKHYIKRLFHSKGISSTGCYSIWLCDSGEWKNFIIDDYIPCLQLKNGFLPRFSSSKGNDMWVLLLEKAYAKLYGSYFDTSTGFQGEALCALTGAPVKYFNLKKNVEIEPLEQIWQFLTAGLNNRFVITVASRKESETVNNKAMGIVSGHAYAVLEAKVVELADDKKERIIKMRNPWGRREWTGIWGDKCEQWTPELQTKLKYKPNPTDGVFWMSLTDFNKHFFQPCVCKLHNNFGYSFVRLGENRKQSTFIAKMEVKTSGYGYITIQQKRRKHFNDNAGYEYSFVRYIIARLDDNGQVTSIVKAKYLNLQNITIKGNFESGSYLVFAEVDWVQNLFNELILTAYSGSEIEFQEEPLSKYNIPALFKTIVKTYMFGIGALSIKSAKIKSTKIEREVWKHSLPSKFGIGAVLLVNHEKKAHLNYKAIATMKNMEIYTPTPQDNNTVIVDVPPKGERMIIFKAKLGRGTGFSYGYKHTESSGYCENLSKEELIHLCIDKGKKIWYTKDMRVVLYMHVYAGGIALLYQNNSRSIMLREDVVFDTDNITINGEDRNTLEIFVPAGEDLLLNVRLKSVFGDKKIKKLSTPTLIN